MSSAMGIIDVCGSLSYANEVMEKQFDSIKEAAEYAANNNFDAHLTVYDFNGVKHASIHRDTKEIKYN